MIAHTSVHNRVPGGNNIRLAPCFPPSEERNVLPSFTLVERALREAKTYGAAFIAPHLDAEIAPTENAVQRISAAR